MTILRFSCGGGTILLSVVGLVTCLAGILGVWMAKGRVEAIANMVFSAADESLVFVDAKLDRVKQALDNSRQRVSGISKLAERLEGEKADARRESEPLLKAIDEVFQHLKAAQSWLESSQAVAQGVTRVSESIVSSDYAASHEDSTGIAIAQRVHEVAEQVAEVLAQLQILRNEVVEARETGKVVKEVAARVIARVADLDGRLANISMRIEKLDTRVANTKASTANLQRRVHWWIIVATVGVTIILAWFAISQTSMMGHGWRMVRS